MHSFQFFKKINLSLLNTLPINNINKALMINYIYSPQFIKVCSDCWR
jgi:hypothetical protein